MKAVIRLCVADTHNNNIEKLECIATFITTVINKITLDSIDKNRICFCLPSMEEIWTIGALIISRKIHGDRIPA